MKSIAGAIVILAASILWSVGFVVSAMMNKSGGSELVVTYVLSAVLGFVGIIVLFAGVVSKGEHR